MLDIAAETKVVKVLSPASQAPGNVEGAAVDTLGFHDALFCLDSGVATATGTLDVHVEESADGSTGWGNVAGAAFPQVTVANDQAVYAGRVRITATRKRYLRLYAVVGTDAVIFGALAVLGEAEQLPAATPEFDIHD